MCAVCHVAQVGCAVGRGVVVLRAVAMMVDELDPHEVTVGLRHGAHVLDELDEFGEPGCAGECLSATHAARYEGSSGQRQPPRRGVDREADQSRGGVALGIRAEREADGVQLGHPGNGEVRRGGDGPQQAAEHGSERRRRREPHDHIAAQADVRQERCTGWQLVAVGGNRCCATWEGHAHGGAALAAALELGARRERADHRQADAHAVSRGSDLEDPGAIVLDRHADDVAGADNRQDERPDATGIGMKDDVVARFADGRLQVDRPARRPARLPAQGLTTCHERASCSRAGSEAQGELAQSLQSRSTASLSASLHQPP